VVKLPATLRDAGVTAREAEVLEALGTRLTNAEIAERLYISVRTVESHVSALLRKLAEPDRLALARRAREALSAGAARVPLPGGLADAVAVGPFVGRDDPLGRLQQLAEVSRTRGVRRLALITGEAGIGKTRLAAETAVRLHNNGAAVCHGRCHDEALIPFQAFSEAVVPLLEGTEDPFARPAEVGSDPGITRHRLFEEFDRLLASRPTPVVFVLDDVQSDRSVGSPAPPARTPPGRPLASPGDRDGATGSGRAPPSSSDRRCCSTERTCSRGRDPWGPLAG
jgi:Response regulator containing a CheY-like receiver domain and an HTH DNA-binding domain